MSTDDIGDFIRSLLRSVPPEAVAGFTTSNDGFRSPRLKPARASKFKQKPDDIDRVLLEDAQGSNHSAQQAGTRRSSIVSPHANTSLRCPDERKKRRPWPSVQTNPHQRERALQIPRRLLNRPANAGRQSQDRPSATETLGRMEGRQPQALPRHL